MGSGDPKSRIMLLGEAPGEREAESGRVFSGRAGQLLDLKLQEAGLPRESVYVSNVVKCRPPDNSRPSRVEWESCRIYLEREVKRVDPRYILLMGNTALQAVCRKSGITKQRGVRLQTRDPLYKGRSLMATIHPAYVLRNPGQDSVFSEDIKRFARMVRGQFQVVPVRGTLVNTVVGLKKLRRILMEANPEAIAYDVENRGAPWEKDWKLLVLGISVDGQRGFVVPLNHPRSPFRTRWKDVLRFLRPALVRPGVKLVAQSGKHDNLQLSGGGLFLEHSFDIMLAAHLLDENRPKNLGFLSQSILGADVYKGMVETKPDRILKVPLKDLALYNAYDTAYTLQIYPKLRTELLKHPRLTRLFAKLMMPASHMIQQVERAGMYVNPDRLGERIFELKEMIDEQKAVLKEHNPLDSKGNHFNYNSPMQLGQWLFSSEKHGGLGLSPLASTPTGRPSTREGVLLHYVDHPAIAALLRYRTLELKWLRTYLGPWLLRLDGNSRLHTHYKLFGTVTGRLSGDLQQIPRDPFIRGVFGAPPGWSFISADFSQVELRIAAHIADERRMKRAFLTGEDLHLLTATQLTGKLPSEVTSEERKKAKAVNFGFLYEMGAWKFRSYAFENFGIEMPQEEAELARKRYFELFPDLPRWHDRQHRVAESLQSVQSPIGRVRHLPDVLSSDKAVRAEALRQAVNSPVQSMASDLMLFAMVKLQDELDTRDCFMTMTLHDGIGFECRNDMVGEYTTVIKQVMENLPIRRTFGCDLQVPIVADVDWGQHWTEWEGHL
jgi:uracil-DNA glycosylase family 4